MATIETRGLSPRRQHESILASPNCVACGDSVRTGTHCPTCRSEILLRALGRHRELGELIFKVAAGRRS